MRNERHWKKMKTCWGKINVHKNCLLQSNTKRVKSILLIQWNIWRQKMAKTRFNNVIIFASMIEKCNIIESPFITSNALYVESSVKNICKYDIQMEISHSLFSRDFLTFSLSLCKECLTSGTFETFPSFDNRTTLQNFSSFTWYFYIITLFLIACKRTDFLIVRVVIWGAFKYFN